jgi:hypothetical protein
MGGKRNTIDRFLRQELAMTTPPVIPDSYKSDHLFLLVGTNPLPNFVAATLMLKPQGQLYLGSLEQDPGGGETSGALLD